MELLDPLLKFTNFRPRSEYEIKQWLRRKKVSEIDSKVVFIQLKHLGLIDDRAFAGWWVEQRNTFRPKSRRALVYELIKKGVDKKLAEEVVGKSQIGDEELAFHLIEKKKRVLERLDPEEREKKIKSLLASRGFGWEVIKKIAKFQNQEQN